MRHAVQQPGGLWYVGREKRSMVGWRNGMGMLCVGALLGGPRVARADAPPWLVWTPPPGCPRVEYVEAKVKEGLQGPVPDDVDLVARAAVTQLDAEWEVRVELEAHGGIGERSIRVADCSDAADFVALVVALAIDPDGTRGGGPAPEAASEGPEVAQPLQAEEATAPQPSDEPVPARSGMPFGFGVSLGALGSVGALPKAALGFEAALASTLGPWQVRTALRSYPTQEVTVAGLPDDFGPVTYEVLGGALALGYRARLRALVLIPTLTIEAAQLKGRGSWELWLRMEAGLELALARAAPFEPYLALGLSVPLTQPTFALIGDIAAHQAGPAGVASLGVRAFLLGP